MSSVFPDDVTVTVGIDFSEIDQEIAKEEIKVDTFKTKVKQIIKNSAASVIQGARLALYTVQAITGSVDQTLFSMMEAGILAFEATVAIATAESLTVVGALKAGLKFAAAIGILVQVNNIRQGKTEIAQRQGQGIAALNAAVTFVG